MQFDFSDKVVLITGATRGLGRQMAFAFARCGANIAVVSRKKEACDKTAAELSALGVEALPCPCNISHWDALDGLVDRVYRHFGRVDVLINNAGLSPLYPNLEAVTEALMDKVLGVNFKGPFRLGVLVGSRMEQAGGGAIINISSRAGDNPSPDYAPYAAAKAALNNLTRALAKAYAPKVRVNCIAAGTFRTDVSKSWDIPALEKDLSVVQAMGRIGNPDEIVGAALYLASEQASFTTGAILNVDGGLY